MGCVGLRVDLVMGKGWMNKVSIKGCGVCGGRDLEGRLRWIEDYGWGEGLDLWGWGDWGFMFSEDFGVEGEMGGY